MGAYKKDHIIQLPATPKISVETLDPSILARDWLSSLEACLSESSLGLSQVFHQESWWRDMLALDWEFHTVHGLEEIQKFVGQHQRRVQLTNFRLHEGSKPQPAFDSPVESLTWLTAMFSFETYCGRGSGVIYLTQAEQGSSWKAYSIYTSLQELKSIEQPLGSKRAEGTLESMPGGFGGGTWVERHQRQAEFVDEEPTVLLIGAGKQALCCDERILSGNVLSLPTGQAGLNLGARLQSLGISCLIIDKNKRVGDNWRKRYRVCPFPCGPFYQADSARRSSPMIT